MNLIFIGSSNFGLRCFNACMEIPNIKVVGVVTAPKIFSISYNPGGVTNVLHADIASRARALQIPAKMIETGMNSAELLNFVGMLQPDAFLVVGWYHMIPKSWRAIAPAYGLHASLLPNYSGGAPLVWAMINGETKTGITLFQMDDGVDSGPIVGQKAERILSDDTIATLYTRIEDRGLELIQEVLPNIAKSEITLRVQDETLRRIMPQRSPEDGWIDWSNDVDYIDRFIRSQTRPYPGAFSKFEGKVLHIWRASIVNFSSDEKTGTVCYVPGVGYVVPCGSGTLQINETSYESETYDRSQLVRLFGAGGQFLG